VTPVIPRVRSASSKYPRTDPRAPVDALHLLLLAELQAVAGELRLACLAVLSRREIALLDCALLRVAAFPLRNSFIASGGTDDKPDRYTVPFNSLTCAIGDLVIVD